MYSLLFGFALLAIAAAGVLPGYLPPNSGASVLSQISSPSGNYLPASSGASLRSSVSTPSASYLPSSGSNLLSGDGGYSNGGYSSGNSYKHVYFYSSQDDEAPARLRINIQPANAQNTKIIFVKAPAPAQVIPDVVAPPSQAEDKTLVYVLLKKQEQGGQITVPSSVAVKSAKPEVYFIRYKNQHEAEQAVHAGVNGQSVGSGLSDLGNEGAFVRSLDSGLGGLGGGFSGGSSLLGGTTGGGAGLGSRYGAPGVSGPYKR